MELNNKENKHTENDDFPRFKIRTFTNSIVTSPLHDANQRFS